MSTAIHITLIVTAHAPLIASFQPSLDNMSGSEVSHSCITSLVPRPLPDFISQLWRNLDFLHSCEIKSGGSGLGTRLLYSLIQSDKNPIPLLHTCSVHLPFCIISYTLHFVILVCYTCMYTSWFSLVLATHLCLQVISSGRLSNSSADS